MNGVTPIPIEVAAEIADIGDESVATEAIVLDALQGESLSNGNLQEIED